MWNATKSLPDKPYQAAFITMLRMHIDGFSTESSSTPRRVTATITQIGDSCVEGIRALMRIYLQSSLNHYVQMK